MAKMNDKGVEVLVVVLLLVSTAGHRWCTCMYRAAHLVFVARESTETTARGMATAGDGDDGRTMIGEDQTGCDQTADRNGGRSRVRPS
jgi:hypothetical protein